MKKFMAYLSALALVIIGFTSCKTGTYSRTIPSDDVAYVQVISSGQMAKKSVEVVIDDTISFEAKVDKLKKSSTRPRTYTITPGRRNIKVYYQGQLIHQQDVFVSHQTTKVITL
ncbi:MULTISPECIES: hypothetical protein [Bacteroides]|uniref:hypothetical protein n=1 Tax=Bacteroides TaxID=816 RepID=UPI001D414499|nr:MULTISPECIES: hypothetical protein [Bacteroides]HJD92989.1 hypothetical protein [Bacteroides coprosuis]